MNIKSAITFIVILLVLFTSCSGSKKVQSNVSKNGKHSGSTIVSPAEISATSDFIEANAQKILGNDSKAQTGFEKCVTDNPSNDAAWYELSKIYAENLDITKAIETGEKAYNLDEKNKYYIANLANLYNKSYNTNKCIEMYEKLVAIDPDDIEIQLEYTNVLLTSQYYDKALKQLDVMESLVGPDPEITLKKVKIYETQNKIDKAYSELEKLVNYYPKENKYLSMLAELYIKNGKTKDAMRCYNKIAENDPNDPYIHFTLADYYKKEGDTIRAHQELVQGFASPKLDVNSKISVLFSTYTTDQVYKEHNHDAYELLVTLAQTHPDDGRAQALLADYYLYDQKLGMARKYYYDALKTVNNPSIYINLLQIESKLSNIDSVNILATKAIDLYPLSPEFYYYRGLSEMQKKDYNNSLKDINDGINLVVKNDLLKSSFYAALGDCYHAMKDTTKAYAAYDNAIILDPENYYVLNNYSYYLSTSNTNLEKAEIMGKKIAEAEPKNSYYLDTYGWALFKNNKNEEALKYIQEALKYSSDDKTSILEHLGDVKWKLNDKNGAVNSWKDAYNAKPNDASPLLKKKIDNQNYYEE